MVKAFPTRVGEGPFVTRMKPKEAYELSESAVESGAATGRRRTIDHFDALATRYGVRAQGATELAITKPDSTTAARH